ncbi:hypothetical protein CAUPRSCDRAFT_12958 [Caulochytrium protostelioides]|uniref:Uncharacterized protein n=1 Tax=Caulochytrium protostelioides TaxID=1555241 RepID=A0A4V1IT01_9FUNG|nr:hypothetical protein CAUPRSCDRAFT_12958 [Caulochytrium protostelioides]
MARRLPAPTTVIPTHLKPHPVPKTTYTPSAIDAQLERARAQNKHKAQQLLATSQKDAFASAKRPTGLKTAALRAQLQAEEAAQLEAVRAARRKRQTASIQAAAQAAAEPPPVVLTAATILREDALIQKRLEKERQALSEALITLRDASAIEEQIRVRMVDEQKAQEAAMQRRRLAIQIGHEDAIAAKDGLVLDNKEKAEEVKAERDLLVLFLNEARLVLP